MRKAGECCDDWMMCRWFSDVFRVVDAIGRAIDLCKLDIWDLGLCVSSIFSGQVGQLVDLWAGI